MIGFDHVHIVGIETKLAATSVVCQTRGVFWDGAFLFRVLQLEAFSPKTHVDCHKMALSVVGGEVKVRVAGKLG